LIDVGAIGPCLHFLRTHEGMTTGEILEIPQLCDRLLISIQYKSTLVTSSYEQLLNVTLKTTAEEHNIVNNLKPLNVDVRWLELLQESLIALLTMKCTTEICKYDDEDQTDIVLNTFSSNLTMDIHHLQEGLQCQVYGELNHLLTFVDDLDDKSFSCPSSRFLKDARFLRHTLELMAELHVLKFTEDVSNLATTSLHEEDKLKRNMRDIGIKLVSRALVQANQRCYEHFVHHHNQTSWYGCPMEVHAIEAYREYSKALQMVGDAVLLYHQETQKLCDCSSHQTHSCYCPSVQLAYQV
jgi:hypothetical protein